MTIKGGSGNDKLYGGNLTAGKQFIEGNGDKDFITTAFWGDEAQADQFIWGDWNYGDDIDAQDEANEFWGHDDEIIGGDSADMAHKQHIWAGDGDDKVTTGDGWAEAWVQGNDGNDHIQLGENNAKAYAYGGAGDDTMKGPKDPSDGNVNEKMDG